MLCTLRSFTCCLLLLLACLIMPTLETRADSVTINTSTVLLDNSNFAAGTTYYAVFQLVGGGTDNNSAVLSNFNFAGGNALSRNSANDPSSGTFLIAPNPNSSAGIEQTGATLTLNITPANAFSLYSQQFVAGNQFSFTFSLTNNYVPGNSFDGFTFQLYDASLETLLYEQTFDIKGALQPAQAVPEPAALVLLGTGLIGIGSAVRRRPSLSQRISHPSTWNRRAPNQS